MHAPQRLLKDEEQERIARLQRGVANDVIILNYDYIVGRVNTILIFPYLVSSRVVQQEFRQYLDGERTDKGKMMALLLELTRSPEETWFKKFIGALSVQDSSLQDCGRPPSEKYVYIACYSAVHFNSYNLRSYSSAMLSV